MADDLAFLFNDPGPTSSRPGVARPTDSADQPVPRQARQLPADIDWMTLRQAHDQTSIPISTLRKWARKGKVRARLTRIDGKELRFVAFEDIVDRARTLDRVVEPVVIDLRDPVSVQVVDVPAPVMPGSTYIEPVATVESVSKEPPPVTEAAPETPVAESPPVVPEGSILVPIDAWDSLLGQLGNLHEAGQQLADARERAAKAETEAEFLKERVREMRKRAEQAELALDVHSSASLLPEAPPPPEPVLQIGWRRFRDRWLGR
jgi:hypothetical protein